jgi:hypothetical protein
VGDGYEAGELSRRVDGVPRGAQVTGRAVVHRRSAFVRTSLIALATNLDHECAGTLGDLDYSMCVDFSVDFT